MNDADRYIAELNKGLKEWSDGHVAIKPRRLWLLLVRSRVAEVRRRILDAEAQIRRQQYLIDTKASETWAKEEIARLRQEVDEGFQKLAVYEQASERSWAQIIRWVTTAIAVAALVLSVFNSAQGCA